jgi:threonine dehydratase
VYVKDETGQPTGSFKVRGAAYALKTKLAREPIGEVVAASTGNHGAAVAFAGRLLGVRVRVFVPERPNTVKAAHIRDAGAALVEAGPDLSAAIDAARDYADRTGAFFLHDASDDAIPIGTATIGAEILEDLPSSRDDVVVYVPMGDTALIRGVASALRLAHRQVRVVGVVARDAPAYYLSWKSGAVVETETADTIADGLAVRRPLAPNVAAIRDLVGDVHVVTEGEMLGAIRSLRAATGIVAEPSGAAATAALVKDSARGRTAVVLVTGGNIAPDIAHRLEIPR